jgi:hypothetical protein
LAGRHELEFLHRSLTKFEVFFSKSAVKGMEAKDEARNISVAGRMAHKSTHPDQ